MEGNKVREMSHIKKGGAGMVENRTRHERRRQTARRGLKVSAAIGVLALMAGACGASPSTSSSSAGTGTGAGSSGTAAAGTGSSGGGSGNTGGSNAASAVVHQAEAALTFAPPGPPINVGKVKGDLVVAVDCAPFAAPPAETTKGAQAAAKVAGVNMRVISGGADNLSQDVGFLQQAINLQPKSIITIGCVTPELTTEMKAAKQKHIPVVVSDMMNPDASQPGQGAGPEAFGIAGQPNALEAKQLAAYIAVSDPTAKVGEITATQLPATGAFVSAFKSQLGSYCPKCAVVGATNVNPAQWATNLAQATTNLVHANPSINYILPVADGMAPYAASALTQLGSGAQIKIVTTQASVGAALSDVKSGKFAADTGCSNLWVGWVAVDQALRAMAGMPPERNVTIPARLLTTGDMSGINATSDSSVFGVSYVQGFKKLWGVSK